MFLGHYGMGFLLPLFLFSRFLWLVILALLIWGVVRLFSGRRASFYHPGVGAGVPPVPPVQPSAMEILRQRYARGEIDAATFDQMRERLIEDGFEPAASAVAKLHGRPPIYVVRGAPAMFIWCMMGVVGVVGSARRPSGPWVRHGSQNLPVEGGPPVMPITPIL
jgi:uncharacterized membrane protein